MSANLEKKSINPSEWISQAEAAQLRGVSKQAISKLVKKGRIMSMNIGGHILVNRTEIKNFKPRCAGRPVVKDKNDGS